MAVSSIDYEKIDQRLLQLLQLISSLEMLASSAPIENTTGVGVIITELDKFRNIVALEIEKQGAR